MMKKFVVLLALSVLLLGAYAQVQVYPYGNLPEKAVKGSSVTYALPTTTFKMTVSVSRVQEVRGYFADYAESLLGLTNIIHQTNSYYRLNSVDIEPLKTADMTQCFVAFSSNAETVNAWNAAHLAVPGELPDMVPVSYQTHTAELPDFFKNYADISYTQQSESFVDTKIIDGVVTQVPSSHTKTVSKSFESKAREAADAIMKSRKDQYALVAGEQETPYTGEALQAMLAELKNWENNYMSLFAGVTIEDTMVYVIYVTPKNLEPTVAFYFDVNKGFDAENGTASDAYNLSFSRFYSKFRENADFQYPHYGYLTRSCRPVHVSLTSKNGKLHDFGVFNMYQAGAIEVVNAAPKAPLDIKTIGFVL